jgi:hypothetical protein
MTTPTIQIFQRLVIYLFTPRGFLLFGDISRVHTPFQGYFKVPEDRLLQRLLGPMMEIVQFQRADLSPATLSARSVNSVGRLARILP